MSHDVFREIEFNQSRIDFITRSRHETPCLVFASNSQVENIKYSNFIAVVHELPHICA